MELGITTFAEVTEAGVSPGERLRQAVEEAVIAEQVGLPVYGVGEHHRPDTAVSAPAIVLATIAGRTERIRLSSSVTVLGLQRFEMYASHVAPAETMRSIELVGTQVAPLVAERLAA